MSLKYIRDYYSVPAWRGARIKWTDGGRRRSGTIVNGTHHLIVRPDSNPRERIYFHPTDPNVVYTGYR